MLYCDIVIVLSSSVLLLLCLIPQEMKYFDAR